MTSAHIVQRYNMSHYVASSTQCLFVTLEMKGVEKFRANCNTTGFLYSEYLTLHSLDGGIVKL